MSKKHIIYAGIMLGFILIVVIAWVYPVSPQHDTSVRGFEIGIASLLDQKCIFIFE
jgi:hypothetical protein